MHRINNDTIRKPVKYNIIVIIYSLYKSSTNELLRCAELCNE